MGCTTKTIRRTRPVWTDGTTSYSLFLPFFRGRVNEITAARMSLLLEGATSNLNVGAGVRYSNDGVSWGSVTAFSAVTALTSGGAWSYGTCFLAPDQGKQWVEYGVRPRNSTGSLREMGQVTMWLDLQSGVFETPGFLSVTVDDDSYADNDEYDIFASSSYSALTYTDNVTPTGIDYSSNDGVFTFFAAGTYKIELTLLLNVSASTLLDIILKINDSEVHTASTYINAAVDPVERTVSILRTVSAGDYLNCYVDSTTAYTVTVKSGSTINISRLA